MIRIRNDDIVEAFLEVAHTRHITSLVLGQLARSPWEERLYGPLVHRLLHLSDGMDIHLVPHMQRESVNCLREEQGDL